MRRSEISIDLSAELTKVFVDCVAAKGLTFSKLARGAHLSYMSVYRVCHPETPKGVSKRAFMSILGALKPDSSQEVSLLRLAGIEKVEEPTVGLFAARVDSAVRDLGLDPENNALLQRLTLEHIERIGSVLQATQECPVERRMRRRVTF